MTARTSQFKHCLVRILLVFVAAGLVVGYVAWRRLFRELPQQFAGDSIEEEFKYGSIGAEEAEGLPYDIWMVLPRLFPEHLPRDSHGKPRNGGYLAFGVAWEPGRETPVGFSKKTIGFDRLGINCAVCHSATYRLEADDVPVVVPTGPTQTFDGQAYLRFLSACGEDPRFTADTLLEEIQYNRKLDWIDKLLYRFVIIPQTRKGLSRQRQRYAWTYDHNRPRWGPGRIDPFNPVKFQQLGLDDDGTIGNSDMMPIWNLGPRRDRPLHWDGLNNDLFEVVLSGAIGDGATNKSVPIARLRQFQDYLSAYQPPRYPFLKQIDPLLVDRGQALFSQKCAECHAPGGARTGTVIPLREIRTDAHRAAMWTQAAVDSYHHYSDGYPWDFSRFANQEGYVSVPLDGLWLRGPFLHNGSVPNLESLLEPAERRPVTFYRGYDVLDHENLGFVTSGAAAESGFLYDTRLPGNGNAGHDGDEYGTMLDAHERRALIEYLKTL